MTRHDFRRTASRFLADRRGNFAMITALTMLPVLLSIGAAVDMSLFYRDKNIVQSAVDAAALAAAKQFPFESDPTRLEEYARDFFEANTGTLIRMDASMTYEGTDWTSDRTRELRISSCFHYDPIFLSMLKIQFAGLTGQECAEADSVIVVGNTTVEVAMVLDTSGSMNDSPAKGGSAKIVTLRSEAQKAIETLFGSGTKVGDEDPVRIAVVPFSGGVNIGSDNRDKWWMDPKGLSPIHHENFNWTTYKNGSVAMAEKLTNPDRWVLKADGKTPLTRQYIYEKLASVRSRFKFAGCVEARPGDYALNDSPPSDTKPQSLFVPYFAPDESSYFSSSYSNNFLSDSYPKDRNGDEIPDTTDNNDLRQKYMNKYFFSARAENTPDGNNKYTPNYMCDSKPILPLTPTKNLALDTIKSLVATGSTNVDQGVAWGWRVLSKSEPFTDGRPAGDDKNVKAMIVMTDGENTYYPETKSTNGNESGYGSYGHAAVKKDQAWTTGRIFDSRGSGSKTHSSGNYTATMDERMAKVCENAKNDGRIPLETARGAQLSDEKGPVTRDGVIIYTIAFDIPATSKVRVDTLLKGCASYKLNDLKDTTKTYSKKEKYFYSADNAAGLQAAFSDIMASLSSLRIAR